MRVAKAICAEDRIHATSYNARAAAAHRLRLPLGPVPCLGAVATAPVVLLLSHPQPEAGSSGGYAFRRSGWPLATLHPDAPVEFHATWSRRFEPLVGRFGAQHVSNSLAVVFLTPWQCEQFDERLRLPSRQRMLDLAAAAGARDAILIVAHGAELWTEHADIASLPLSRRVHARSRRRTEMTEENLGDAWDAVCRRIEVHAWL
jgi:hypothetical protein